MKRIFISLMLAAVFLTAVSSRAFSLELLYDFSVGDEISLTTTVTQTILVNGSFYAHRLGLYRAELSAESVSNGFVQWEGNSTYLSRAIDSTAYRREQSFAMLYYQNRLGEMEVADSFALPTVRGVPTFPELVLKEGDSWTASASEYHEGVYEGFPPITFDFDVKYRLSEISTNEKDEILAEISADYNILHFPGDLYIISFTGYSHSDTVWNATLGRMEYGDEEYSFVITLVSGENIVYTGSSHREIEVNQKLTDEERETLFEEIRDAFDDEEEVLVTEDSPSLFLSFQNLLFGFDESKLTETAEAAAMDLAEILIDYPSLDIAITGYTDNMGSSDYNQALSETRAQTLAEKLIELGIPAEKISYLGMGELDPVAENSTAEGRAQNRRVEIEIITE